MAGVPPVVADSNANALLDLVHAGAARPNSAVLAARACKRAREAVAVHNATGATAVTSQEVGEQQMFALSQTMAAMPAAPAAAVAAGVAPPPWFAPAMAAVNAQLAALAPVPAQLANMNARLANIEARQQNSVAMLPADRLAPLLNAAGGAVASFPATLGALTALPSAELGRLLGAYGKSPYPVATRLQRLKQFLGMRL